MPCNRKCVLACLVLAWAAAVGRADEEISLSRPLDRQVFQRDAKGRASVLVEGTGPKKADRVEARCVVDKSAAAGTTVEWTAVAAGEKIEDGRFAGSLSVPAGGWYRLEVRAKKGGVVLATAAIERVGAGDVFVTAGQSNSANYGRPRQKAKDDRVVYFDGKRFGPAQDPIPGGCGGGGSPWPLLGDLLVRATRAPVCFRSASLTWTQVKNWMPGARYKLPLYKNLVSCARWFGPGGVRGVLWHQGESDSLARTTRGQYFERLAAVIRAMRKDVGYDVPWFVAGASFHPGSKLPAEREVFEGQRRLWEKGLAFQGPTTDPLLGPTYRSDGVHFNQLGLETHAQLWFAAIWAQQLAPVPLRAGPAKEDP